MDDQPVGTTGQNVAGEVPDDEPEAVTDDTTVHDDDVELERTIGLSGGLAAESAGLAATLSFAIGAVVAGVFGPLDASLTLFHVASEDETDADAETLLDAAADRLTELGVAESAIETRIDRDQGPLAAIVDAAGEYDAVVMGETDPSLATFVFGMPADQVATRFLGPVLVVQREPPAEDE